jgi:hypothetical protein
VTPQLFCIAFLLGTGAIALWLNARFPRFAPSDLHRALVRAGIAMAATWLLFPPLWDAAVASGPVLVALFAVAFPCLTYLLLSAVWAIEKLQAVLRGAR